MPEALKYAWPGENGSPSGSSEFTGESHKNDGPYAMRGGKYFSLGAVKDLARTLDLLITDDGQRIFEKLIAELAALKIDHATTLAEQAEREQECVALNARVDELEAEIAELQVERDRQTTLATIAAKFVDDATVSARASKQNEPAKSRKLA